MQSDRPESTQKRRQEPIRPHSNPRLVWFLNYALDEISSRWTIRDDSRYSEWLSWAATWLSGRHSPDDCVRVAHIYFDQREDNPVCHCLGQLAWAGKEACYDTPRSGWLVIRYIADAMIAFGVAFPDEAMPLLGPPTERLECMNA